MAVLNKEEIKAIIPHREPFLLIDEVTELVPGERVAAVKRVSADEYYFQGHFPGKPVMPGVLQVEALAQAGAVCVLSLPEHQGKLAYFGAIDRVKFRGVVEPGDELRLEVELSGLRSRGGKGTAAAYKDGKLVCSCEL
ncbi:MAG: 3-hydroxyacyl-ACP dehydratase FabZ, partial [Clostridiales Family XIII bacterium]|nr:3-hydroxyacyl-ACP dehydratase FabZ [Clostridiales Family XIII bacterium]